MTVRVVCFGNPLHGDDGFGQHAYRRLRELGVDAVDAGTAGLDALRHLEGCDKAIVVDAVRTGAPAGTVHRLVPGDLDAPGGELSLHDLGVTSLLAALRDPPDIVVVGAEAGAIRTFSAGLSAPLAAALPRAVRMVLGEIEAAGG
jgi:hydrogenase maturation protease